MPKVKTKKIVMKRFKLTAGGKITHRVQGARHLRSNKSASRKRRQDKSATLDTNKYIQNMKRFMQT
jgi:large subunit ribosomal protein L35